MSTIKSELISRLKGVKSETKIDTITNRETLIRALNNYQSAYDKKQAYSWLETYCRANGMTDMAKAIKENRVHHEMSLTTIGYCARLVSKGLDIPELNKAIVNEKISHIKILPEVVKPEPPPKRPTLRINPILYRLDEQMDNIMMGKKSNPVTLEGTKSDIDETVAFVTLQLFNIKTYKDEYYGGGADAKLIKLWEGILAQAQSLAAKVRKPRAKKAKPASQIVSKLKYLNAFIELGLKSVKPETLLGVREAILYDTKTRTIRVLRTADANGLTVSGTTIGNISDKSFAIRVRKPEALFGGAKTHKAIMAGVNKLTTTKAATNGRTNEGTILLTISK